MFKLVPSPESTVDVPITRPGEDKPGTLRLRFRHKSRKEYKAWLDTAAGRDDSGYLLDVVVGWEGVEDAEGKPVPFTPEAFASLVDQFPAAGIDIFKAYGKALHESRTGN